MYIRRRPLLLRPMRRKARVKLTLLVLLISFTAFLVTAVAFLRRVSTEMAISDAIDIVTLDINSSVNELMRSDSVGYDRFVSLETGPDGSVTAIQTNMAEINALAADMLDRIVGKGDRRIIEVDVPLGNLLGSSLLMGKGPMVPLDIIMLTSSRIDFHNSLEGAGINQTKHRIIFEITVQIDILLPWDMAAAEVKSDVIVAETVIVGTVPETYIVME